MYYRFEVYCEYSFKWIGVGTELMSINNIEELSAPFFTKKGKHKGKFWFTERGFDKFGRLLIDFMKGQNIQYRLIKVKEKSIDIAFRDEYQVCGKMLYKPKKHKIT